MKSIILLFVLSIACRVFGENETNTLYVNDDDSTYIDGKGIVGINPHKIEVAKTNQESWPAKDFPEGNWGKLKEGIQVSLRLDKPIYTNGESINAIVLIRNSTNRFFGFWNTLSLEPKGVINLRVFNGQEQIVCSNIVYTGIKLPSAGEIIDVKPGTQRKYLSRLNNMCHFTNGNYFIQASITPQIVDTNRPPSLPPNVVFYPYQRAHFDIESAKVPIEIK